MTVTGAVGLWENPLTWTATPAPTGTYGAASRVTLTDTQIFSTGLSSFKPTVYPQCAVEIQTRAGSPNFTVKVVTARGFSTDYTKDSNGHTTGGSVVWLQSVVNVSDVP